MVFSTGNVTRTYYECKATAIIVKGMKDDGTPDFETVDGGTFWSTKENDVATGYKLCKAVNKAVVRSTVQLTTVNSMVIAMSNEDFFTQGVQVERKANGKVVEK